MKKGCSIGANATIVCGITIGEYAFVGAGSVVTKDVAPYSLVYGSPAKHRGWVSKRGNKLQFDKNGYAVDEEDHTHYQLEDGLVVVMEEEYETVFDLVGQYHAYKDEIDQAILSVLKVAILLWASLLSYLKQSFNNTAEQNMP